MPPPPSPDQDPRLKVVLDLLVADLVATSDVTGQRATEQVHRVAQARPDHLHSVDTSDLRADTALANTGCQRHMSL
jgi:hypothetical protein